MKELVAKLGWKKCHISTVNDNFVLIETDEKEKVLINLQFVRIIVEAKEGVGAPVFVPRDL